MPTPAKLRVIHNRRIPNRTYPQIAVSPTTHSAHVRSPLESRSRRLTNVKRLELTERTHRDSRVKSLETIPKVNFICNPLEPVPMSSPVSWYYFTARGVIMQSMVSGRYNSLPSGSSGPEPSESSNCSICKSPCPDSLSLVVLD